MATHIKIDTKQLADMGTQLGKLHDSLNSGPDIVSSYNGDMGSGDVAKALSDFAGDWSKKKASLLDQLQELSEAATGAAKTWDGADADLAKALLQSDQANKKSGGKS